MKPYSKLLFNAFVILSVITILFSSALFVPPAYAEKSNSFTYVPGVPGTLDTTIDSDALFVLSFLFLGL